MRRVGRGGGGLLRGGRGLGVSRAKKRIERVKEVKRALKNWEGWRLDLVENRRGGGEGVGEIFEV